MTLARSLNSCLATSCWASVSLRNNYNVWKEYTPLNTTMLTMSLLLAMIGV